jgi:hypothetical protein
MNFGKILGLIFQLAIPAVLGIQAVHGDQVAGADKKTMALDALNIATQTALSVLPAGSNAAGAAQAASNAASAAIDAAVAITKATGQYQAATMPSAGLATS